MRTLIHDALTECDLFTCCKFLAHRVLYKQMSDDSDLHGRICYLAGKRRAGRHF